MFLKIFGSFFGADPGRDKELLFLTLMLEIGRPKNLQALRVKHGGKSATPLTEPDVSYVIRFAALAHANGFPLKTDRDLDNLHTEYQNWYETCDTASTKSS